MKYLNSVRSAMRKCRLVVNVSEEMHLQADGVDVVRFTIRIPGAVGRYQRARVVVPEQGEVAALVLEEFRSMVLTAPAGSVPPAIVAAFG